MFWVYGGDVSKCTGTLRGGGLWERGLFGGSKVLLMWIPGNFIDKDANCPVRT